MAFDTGAVNVLPSTRASAQSQSVRRLGRLSWTWLFNVQAKVHHSGMQYKTDVALAQFHCWQFEDLSDVLH